MAKVSVYIREHGSRDFTLAHPKTIYPEGTIFVLRFTRGSKRVWETLDVTTYGQAFSAAKMREVEIYNSSVRLLVRPSRLPKAVAATPAPRPSGTALDATIDLYLANVQHKSGKSSVIQTSARF